MADTRRGRPLKQYQGSVAEQSNATSRANQEVSIENAPGLALGRDGYRHPIEVNAEGELQTQDIGLSDVFDAIERLNDTLQLILARL